MSPTARRSIAIAWTLLIVAACSIPGRDLPNLDIDWIDKAAHFVMFAVLAWLWLEVGSGSLVVRCGLIVTAGSLFGVLIEFYQGLLPWERTPDILDAVANSAGLIGGTLAFAARARFISRPEGNL
jgi:VanZ family protein